ncbi:MAG: hypothetical protein KF886_06105 [Candidatus Hydrogenedentes bacterium]|nr:hypothetical protein [Candidatus Hydrogenedentota bacterium]
MIRFSPVAEPVEFDEKCRKPGARWLAGHPNATRPYDYWSPFRPELLKGFDNLCAYCAMFAVGDEQVDHYVGCKEDISLAYEWSNYRPCKALMNNLKSHRKQGEPQILDPFALKDEWFELLLPSLQVIVTDRVPSELKARAEFTLLRLGLRDDERVIRLRRAWLELYEQGDLTIHGLEKMAPLIARAVRKRDGEDRE